MRVGEKKVDKSTTLLLNRVTLKIFKKETNPLLRNVRHGKSLCGAARNKNVNSILTTKQEVV